MKSFRRPTLLVSYPEVEAKFLGTVTQVGVGSDEPVNTVQRDLRWGCLLEIGKQAERFFHNTIKINYTFALAVISNIKIRTIRQTKVPT